MLFNISYFKKPKNWIWIIIVFDLFFKSLITYLHLPSSVTYINDFCCLILLHALIMKYKSSGFGDEYVQFRIVLFLLIESILGYVNSLFNPFAYFWGIRTLFRFFIVFFATATFVNETMIKKFIKLLYWMIIISIPVSTIQFFLGYEVDSVTAFFSEGKHIVGGNAAFNMLMCLATSYYLVAYLCKKIPLYKLIVIVLSCVYMASIAEIKMYYFELIVILFLAMIYTKVSVQKIIGSFIGIVIIEIGFQLYGVFFGGRNTLDLQNMLDYAGVSGKSYGSMYRLNRFTAIPYVWDNILTTIPTKLFGLGAGYADNVTTPLLSSGFFLSIKNEGFHLWTMSLELTNIGMLGLILLVSFFVSIYIYVLRKQKSDPNNDFYYIITKITVVLVFITLFYNTSIIIETAAPFLYFTLAIPFSINNAKKKVSRGALNE